MSDTQTLVKLVSAMGQNLVYNLDFIPADKFEWKPAPTAKSVHEIVNHMLENFDAFNARFDQATPQRPANDIAAAKERLQGAFAKYGENLSGASSDQLAQIVHAQGMDIPLDMLAKMLTVDTINHHGQITYIQSLLGDEESHFDMSAFAHLQ